MFVRVSISAPRTAKNVFAVAPVVREMVTPGSSVIESLRFGSSRSASCARSSVDVAVTLVLSASRVLVLTRPIVLSELMSASAIESATSVAVPATAVMDELSPDSKPPRSASST